MQGNPPARKEFYFTTCFGNTGWCAEWDGGRPSRSRDYTGEITALAQVRYGIRV